MRRSIWVISLAAALSQGCASTAPLSPESMNPAHRVAERSDVSGVNNFAQMDARLYRGEQPTAEGFAELKRRDIKTVVDLRFWHDDRPLLKGLGLQYVRIRSNAWHIEDEDVAAFLLIVRDPANQPVFVHCQHGSDRTGAMIGAYRIMQQGWSSDEAVAELSSFGFHSLFANVVSYLRGLSAEAMNQRIAETKAPQIEIVP